MNLHSEEREILRTAMSNIAYVAKKLLEEGDEEKAILLKDQCSKIKEYVDISFEIDKLKEYKLQLEKEINGIEEKI